MRGDLSKQAGTHSPGTHSLQACYSRTFSSVGTQVYTNHAKEYSRQVSSHTGTNTTLLGGGIYGHKDKIGLIDSTLDVSAEKEVLATAGAHDIVEAGFVDGQIVRVPGVDTALAQVDDGDLDIGALEGDNGASRATCDKKLGGFREGLFLFEGKGGDEGQQRTDVAGANAADLLDDAHDFVAIRSRRISGMATRRLRRLI